MLTNVKRDVLPDPLDPRSKNEGSEVELDERYISRCRRSGIEITSKAVIKSVIGSGCVSMDLQSCPRRKSILKKKPREGGRTLQREAGFYTRASALRSCNGRLCWPPNLPSAKGISPGCIYGFMLFDNHPL